MSDGSLLFDTKLDSSGFKKGLGSLGGMASKTGGMIAKGIGVASTALAGFGIYAIKSSVEFESAFTGVIKTVDGTDEQLANLRQGILDMSLVMPQRKVGV